MPRTRVLLRRMLRQQQAGGGGGSSSPHAAALHRRHRSRSSTATTAVHLPRTHSTILFGTVWRRRRTADSLPCTPTWPPSFPTLPRRAPSRCAACLLALGAGDSHGVRAAGARADGRIIDAPVGILRLCRGPRHGTRFQLKLFSRLAAGTRRLVQRLWRRFEKVARANGRVPGGPRRAGRPRTGAAAGRLFGGNLAVEIRAAHSGHLHPRRHEGALSLWCGVVGAV